jgi:hypothetical protein
MAMPPLGETADSEQSFQRLRRLQIIWAQFLQAAWTELDGHER